MSASYREAGSGPGVVCLHSNASSSGQWRALMEMLAPKFRVLAADSYGAGKSPARPAGAMLRDEVELLEPVFARAGEPFALVEREAPRDVDGIRNTVTTAVSWLKKDDRAAAARTFIDFWMEPGAFDRMPERNREVIAAAGIDVDGWRQALFGEPTPLDAFARLDVPVLLLVGKRSPLSSRAVARLLARTLPRVELVELEDCGHMAPVTHPERVNGAIARFLEAT